MEEEKRKQLIKEIEQEAENARKKDEERMIKILRGIARSNSKIQSSTRGIFWILFLAFILLPFLFLMFSIGAISSFL